MARTGNKRGGGFITYPSSAKTGTAIANKKAKTSPSTLEKKNGKGNNKAKGGGRPKKTDVSERLGPEGESEDELSGASTGKKVKANARSLAKEVGKSKWRGRYKQNVVLESTVSSDEGEDELLEALSQSQGDADSEETESMRHLLKELQAMVEQTEKKDNFQKEFEAEVRAEEKRLLGLLDELEGERQSEREAFHAEFSSLLATALSPSGIDKDGEATQASSSPPSASSPASTEHGGTPLIRFPNIDEHPIHVTYSTLMEEFRAIVTDYDEVKRQTENFHPPEDFSKAWEADYAEARRLISIGRVATEAEITKLLTYKDSRNRRSRGEGKEETNTEEFRKDEHLQTMLKMGRDGQKGNKKVYGWANAAHRLEKGFRRLARALPDEEE
ncbi:hypothetical protein FQN54_005606 [Arachnomyces sp. PD_36]|nr:hypothetical protein FQN54_005606 [Arachnomyces sp. PD_36]